jgi:hypothetical protein
VEQPAVHQVVLRRCLQRCAGVAVRCKRGSDRTESFGRFDLLVIELIRCIKVMEYLTKRILCIKRTDSDLIFA